MDISQYLDVEAEVSDDEDLSSSSEEELRELPLYRMKRCLLIGNR